MGYTPLLRGRVQGLARGINVPNATPDATGLASVNPIFTFVRLAQRVPVRIHIDEVPEGVKLVAGLTATVQVEPYNAPPASNSAPAVEVSQAAQPATLKTLAESSPQAAAPRNAPSQGPIAAAPPAPPAQAAGQPAPRAAEPQAAAQAASGATQQQKASQSAASAGDQLPVSAVPSEQASAAAAAAAADLKTLEEQIAANPPSGSASPSTAANGASAAGAEFMPPNQYLGQTFDLFGDQSATPAPKPRSPDLIRRRARSTWRHSGQQ
jgi:hypothetical protein